ncbi:hypothetical protein [Maritalea sp.]|jgi:hypothetical protein|uniref:hypothetical protein n=1 Tax=Maritalea sp. TaxID=2003361 RepID=UPI0039E37F42
MAKRKQFSGDTKVDRELEELLTQARKTTVSEEQLHEQRVSFAFGNSPDSEFITKDSVRRTSQTIRLAV